MCPHQHPSGNQVPYAPARSPLVNQAIGAILQPSSIEFINYMSAQLGFSSKTITKENWHEVVELPERVAFISLHLCKRYYIEGRYDQAILWGKVAIEVGHPDEAIIAHNIAVAYFELGDYQAAIGMFEYAIELGYDDVNKVRKSISILQECLKQDETSSQSDADSGIYEPPKYNPSIFYELGKLHFALGNHVLGLDCFKLARNLAIIESEMPEKYLDLPSFPSQEIHGTPLGDIETTDLDDSGIEG